MCLTMAQGCQTRCVTIRLQNKYKITYARIATLNICNKITKEYEAGMEYTGCNIDVYI